MYKRNPKRIYYLIEKHFLIKPNYGLILVVDEKKAYLLELDKNDFIIEYIFI